MRYRHLHGRSQLEELDNIQRFTEEPTVPSLSFEILYAAPARPYAGLVVYADGTTWNPGGGQGLYRYNLAGAWVFVG